MHESERETEIDGERERERENLTSVAEKASPPAG
jgi:hypothetical protein